MVSFGPIGWLMISEIFPLLSLAVLSLPSIKKKVRRKLVEDWLPVLVACKDKVAPTLPINKSLSKHF